MGKELKLGEKFISGKIVSLDEEKIDNLNNMSKSLKQVEKNIKENIVAKMK